MVTSKRRSESYRTASASQATSVDMSYVDSGSDDDSSAVSSSSSDEGESVPESDPISRTWRTKAMHKFIYFRWSTACSSKNRFRGVVTDHKARIVPSTGKRVDYLVVKTFGISEDRYVMGKDIREFYVLPSKSVLMAAKSEDDIKREAVKKWNVRDGWQSLKGDFDTVSKVIVKRGRPLKKLDVSSGLVPRESKVSMKNLPQHTKSISQVSTAPSTPVVRAISGGNKIQALEIISKHSIKCVANRIPNFAFASFN